MTRLENIAVILAGGTGSRLGSETPKQFTKIHNKTIIEYSIEQFQQHNDIDKILIVSHIDYIPFIQSILKEKSFSKVLDVIAGGSERYLSTYNAIQYFNTYSECNLLLHDAARPIIDKESISKVVHALENYEAVALATPATDTIIKTNKDMLIEDIPDRSFFYNAQTPQAFRLSLISLSFKRAIKDKNLKLITDDCSLVLKYGNTSIHLVEGNQNNIKITFNKDIALAEALLSS